MNTLEVITLAGGKGARMGELTRNAQKCLLELEGKPILGHLMDKLVEAFGSVDMKFGVCYRRDEVVDYVMRNKPKNVTAEFFDCVEGEGEKGYFLRARPLIKGDFICAPGDIVALPDAYRNAISIYKHEGVDGVISVSPQLDVIDSHGIAKVVGGKTVDLRWPAPNPVPDGYMRDMTIWPGDKKFFELIDQYTNIPRRGMSWVYIEALKDGRPLGGNIYTSPWVHIGYPKDLSSVIPR